MQQTAMYMLGAVGSSLLLAMVCGALYARERAPHLLRWTLSWLCAAGIRLHVMVIGNTAAPHLFDLVLAGLYTAQVAWWLSGTRFYSGRTDAVRWPWIAAGGLAALGIAMRLAQMPLFLRALPITVLLAAGLVWAGALVFQRSAHGMGGWMAGGGLVAFGVHTILTLPQYANGDFASAFVGERALGVVLGLGMVFVHVDAAYERIHHREAMILHADEGLLQLDLAGHTTEANPALARILGCSDVAHVLRTDLSPLVGALLSGERPNGGLAFEQTAQWRRFSDGKQVWLTLRTRPHRDAQGMPNGYQVHVQDSTESYRLTERLRRAEKLNSLGQLAGGVAHDFNNVLAVIQGSLELADQVRDSNPEKLDRMLERARNATDRGANLTRRLLDFARHRPERLEVLDLVETGRQSLALLEQTIPQGVRVTYEGEGPAFVKGDRGQFERVLMNLVLNACDAMPEGGSLEVHLHAHAEWVRMEVRDTGTGIAAEHLAQIFDPFFTTREGGTGLGLATVFGIVSSAGGTIDVHSDEKGTAFVVDLPASDPPPSARDTNIVAPEPRRRTVLVVDDEPDVRAVAAEMLVAAGYRVLQARDGLEALEVARISGYLDLLITDVVMPGMRGAELADALQRNFEGLPVVFLSAYPQKTDPDALQDRRRTFLAKPFRRKTLISAVQQALIKTEPDTDHDSEHETESESRSRLGDRDHAHAVDRQV